MATMGSLTPGCKILTKFKPSQGKHAKTEGHTRCTTNITVYSDKKNWRHRAPAFGASTRSILTGESHTATLPALPYFPINFYKLMRGPMVPDSITAASANVGTFIRWAVFFFVVWVRLLLCCLRHCLRNAYAATVGAYAAHPFEGVPTQAQRPHKATPQCMFLPTPSHFCLLLEGWKRNFCLRDHSPIHIFAARAPRLQSAHRHLAATPMCSSRTSNQVPKRTLNISWINHDKSLKTQLVTFDYAGVKPSDVFDCR